MGVCGGEVDVFVEPLAAPPTIVVVGGGHVGRQVAHLAKLLGYRVVVADDRPEYATPQAAPDADQYTAGPLSELPEKVKITPSTYVLLTTRGFSVDVESLPPLLDIDAAYIGVIGSRRSAGSPSALRATPLHPTCRRRGADVVKGWWALQ